jgi:hypothetical protein
VLLPLGTSHPAAEPTATSPRARNRAATLTAMFRSVVAPIVSELRPRIGSRRAGRNRPANPPAERPSKRPSDRPATPPAVRAPDAEIVPIRPSECRLDFDNSALTIVITLASDVRLGAPAMVARLAELAVFDELLVVCGSTDHNGSDANALTVGLRRRLPRHEVVTLQIAPHAGASPHRGAALINEFLEVGSLPIVVTPVVAVRDVVAELTSYLHADRVLSLSCTATGANLRQLWARREVVAQTA